MTLQTITPHESIALFVKSILVFEETVSQEKTCLPFFADGYPGLMFQETENGLLVNPHQKLMPELFIYGQTIHPIELEIKGTYKLIVFQLFPFVLKSFFDISAQSVNDDCYNLANMKGGEVKQLLSKLNTQNTVQENIELLSLFLTRLFETKKQSLDFKVKQVIEFILKTKGQQSIALLASQMKLTERTLERRFLAETGLSPKQFSKIIQFQLSLEQLTLKDYQKLTDIVYENGYTDQSHFIKVFKAFTGKTPNTFRSK